MNLSPLPIQKFFDNNGRPLNGGLLFTYVAGTSTKLATYSDQSGTLNTNPVVLNFRGEANVWLDQTLTYKFVLAPEGDTDPPSKPIWSVDNISAAVTYASLTQQIIGRLLWPQTPAEAAANATPVDYGYEPGDSRRFSPDTTGVQDVTTVLQQFLDAAGIAADSSDGQIVVATIYPGTYQITRLYMHYSNVRLNLMPGCILKSTSTTGTNTTGLPPAYAAIHINPLTYVANPVSPITAIENVSIGGGGSVTGPYTVTGAYNGFTLGIVSNDCHSCVVENLYVFGFHAENILLNPSAWNTCENLQILQCEVEGGGEVGINNARSFQILSNYVHDSWMQNGLGGNGDGGMVAFNNVKGMFGAGMTVGGSGARDINECRNIIYGFNTLRNCNVGSAGGQALSLFDDGATSTPKNNLLFIGNIIQLNQGNALVAADFTSGEIDFSNNILSSLQGTDPTLFAIVSGGATYRLRDNSFLQGSGNAARCVDIQSGTPTVLLEEGQYYDPSIATDIQGPGDFTIVHEYHSSFTATLTGVSGTVTATMYYSKKVDHVTLYLAGITGTSTTTSATVTGLPAWITPTRNQNFLIPITNNSVNAIGIVQVKSDGTLALFSDINGTGFTAANTKGITGPYVVTYVLN